MLPFTILEKYLGAPPSPVWSPLKSLSERGKTSESVTSLNPLLIKRNVVLD